LETLNGQVCDRLTSMEEIIREHLPKIKRMAWYMLCKAPPQIDIDDLVSAGLTGLFCAIRDFQVSMKTSFQTYAVIKMKGAMLDEMRHLDWVPRSVREKYKQLTKTLTDLDGRLGRAPSEEEIQRAMDMNREEYEKFLHKARPLSFISIEDIGIHQHEIEEFLSTLSAQKFSDPLTLMKNKEQREALAKAIDVLPERERLVIALYYYEELNLKEIGQILKITESRVCQLHTQAIVRLKAKLQERGW
jgi:RNA polymerase sigma factor for flagellar operon FliA